MNTDRGFQVPTQALVIALLSDDEVANVNRQGAAASVAETDECLDLEQLGQGVRLGPGPPRPICRLLARKAVHEATWTTILMWLSALKAAQRRRRAGCECTPRGARLGEARLAVATGGRAGR